jgi:hypothetical protein
VCSRHSAPSVSRVSERMSDTVLTVLAAGRLWGPITFHPRGRPLPRTSRLPSVCGDLVHSTAHCATNQCKGLLLIVQRTHRVDMQCPFGR